MQVGHPYAPFIHTIEKPARYTGGEYNAVIKPWDSVSCRFALGFPDVYDIGMSHMGTKILYSVVNKTPDLLMERCFCPWFDMEAALRERSLPLVTLESAKPLHAFDVVGFSLQYEMTFTNVLTMLDLGGVPLKNEDRTLRDPFVIAGGPAATHPEPLAPFIDLFLIGDAEERLPVLLRDLARLRAEGVMSRREILAYVAAQGGVYCPDLYTREVCERSGLMYVSEPCRDDVPRRVQRAFLDDISRFRFPDDSPVPVAEAIFDRMAVEIARGCTEGCRFCQAGMIYRPVRERDPEEVVETLVSAIEKGGYDEAAVTALSTADYSCVAPLIKKVMERLRPMKVSLGISSLRAYGLSDELLDDIASVKATGLTFAPEAGTQRMRDVINKNISEDDIFTTCHRVFSKGWQRIKLYFMIGLPTETDDDVAGIVAMGRQAFEIGRRYVRKVDVTVAISSHVPKPHTPFQWCAMDSIPELLRKQKIVFDGARKAGVWARKHDHRVSHLEGILARGDYRTGRLLELAWRNGARFDGWDEHLNWRAWSEALESWESETGLERTMMLGTLPVDAHLPWDHIDVGLEDGFLLKEYKKALVNRLSPPCGKPFKAKVHHTNVADAEADKRLLVCYHCGIACDLKKMREERIDFLDRLGAREPIAAEDRPHPRATAHERIKAGLKPHDFAQGEPQHVRLRYGKLGSMALQGHLDMITMLPRVARRAGIEVYFSEGFSPKPLTSAGPALGMGMRSISEYVDIAFAQPVPAGWLLQQLNAFAPDGLLFLEAAPLGPSKEGVSAFIDAARYVAALPSAAGTAESVERRIAELLASDPEVEAIRKDKSKRVRLSRALASARVTRAGELAPLLGVGESDPVVEVTQHIVENTLKPTEVYRVVCGVEVEPHAIVRVAMGRLVEGRIEAPTATDPRVRTGAATASIGEARAWHAERVRIVAPVVGANDQFEPADDGDEAALEFGAPVPEPQRPGMAALVPDAVPDLRALASLREAPGALAAGEA